MFGMSDGSEYAILVVLLPLIPAFLIFLVFPKSDMAAQGPLQGLSIRAGGAFGAYLIVLLVLISWVSFSEIHKMPRAWTVLANVVVKDESGKVIPPSQLDERGLNVQLEPKYVDAEVRKNGLRMAVTLLEQPDGKIPKIKITYRNGNATLNLNDLEDGVKAERNDRRNVYTIRTPLEIVQTASTTFGAPEDEAASE
jgi:hypothetical protein